MGQAQLILLVAFVPPVGSQIFLIMALGPNWLSSLLGIHLAFLVWFLWKAVQKTSRTLY